MKKFFETLGFLVFTAVTAVGGFIVYCVLTDRLDLIEEMKERCGLGSCCCFDDDDDYFEDEFYEYDDLEDYFDDEEYDEDDEVEEDEEDFED